MANLMWDQSVFNRTLDTYLKRLSEDKLPGALNKKAFFIGLRAMAETPKVNPHKIFWELQRTVIATREDGSTGTVAVGYAIAAKRASGKWIEAEEKARGRKRKSGTWRSRAWRKLVQRKFETMVGGRQRATGFIRIGWLAVVKKLGPLVKDKGGAPSADMSLRQRGGPKGAAFPARPGFNPTVTISNSAQARSDKLNGLLTVGGPALDRAFASETADMVAYLEREALKEETEKFNAANRR